MTGLRLVAAAPTAAQRRAEFGGDHHLDEAGRNAARALTIRSQTWVSAPGHAPAETAAALGAPHPRIEPALRDADYGDWTGRTLDEVDALPWLTDPAHRPPGGESLHDLRHRVGTWLDTQAGNTLVAVAPTTVIRALLAHALHMPADGHWHLDVAPLAVVRLTHNAGRWHLHLR